VERGEDVGTVGDLQIALFGQCWRFHVLLGCRGGQSFSRGRVDQWTE
jgi:hypothetical protein